MKGFYLKALTQSATDHGGKLLSKSSSFFLFFVDRWSKVAFSVIFIVCCLGRGGGGSHQSSVTCSHCSIFIVLTWLKLMKMVSSVKQKYFFIKFYGQDHGLVIILFD